jgi:hypothetical protein
VEVVVAVVVEDCVVGGVTLLSSLLQETERKVTNIDSNEILKRSYIFFIVF